MTTIQELIGKLGWTNFPNETKYVLNLLDKKVDDISQISIPGEPGPIGPQGEIGLTGAPGAVGPAGLTWQGEWVSGTSYIEDDAVGNNDGSYFCILATDGTIEPYLDTTHWALLALQGAVGPAGEQGPIGPEGPASTVSLKWYAENATAPFTAPIATGWGSIAIGSRAEAKSTGMYVIGDNAGLNATGAALSIFIGGNAGFSAALATESNFIGYSAGGSATNARDSNFIGYSAGNYAANAAHSNFIGYSAGNSAANASYSNFFGYYAGKTFAGNNIGSNNIIIGTNISLPNATANSINLGGILFGTGAYATATGNPSIVPSATGKIGIGVVTPTKRLHIYGEAANDSGLRLERLTSVSPVSTGQAIGVDANGNVITVNSGIDPSLYAPITNPIFLGDGITVPSLTTLEISAIVDPTEGAIVYNTDYNWFTGYNGANWYAFGGSISGELGIINYVYTGGLLNTPIAVITAPPPALASGYVPDYSGKWVSTLVLPTNNPTLDTFTFVDLQGMMGSFTANSILSLKEYSFPALTTVLGTFGPGTAPLMTIINAPLLTYIGGDFAVNNMTGFVSMSYPVLDEVGGAFSPTNLPAVTSFSFPALRKVGTFNPSNMNGLTTMVLPALTTVVGNLSPNTMSALVHMTFSTLSDVGGAFIPNTMSGMVDMNCPALLNVGGTFGPSGMVALTSMSFPSLASVGGNFAPSAMNGITLVSFPSLYDVGGDFAPTAMVAVQTASFSSLTIVNGNFQPNTMNGLTSLTIPALTTVGGNLAFSQMDGVYVLTFPSLKEIGGSVIPSAMVVITTISLSAIERIASVGINGSAIALSSGTPTLTTFILGPNLKQVGNNGAGNVIITSAVLGQVYVDDLLVKLAALDGTNGTTTFDNRIVTIKGTCATPSATGLAAKATLQARGCVVTHN